LYPKFGSLGRALQYAYPETHWNLSKFSHRGKKSGQRWLRVKIEELLPGTEIVEDYQHPDLIWGMDSLFCFLIVFSVFYFYFCYSIYLSLLYALVIECR
jgi:hypothetical protein